MLVAAVLLLLISILLLLKPQFHWKRRNVTQGFPTPIFGDSLRNFLGLESLADLTKRVYFRFPEKRYTGMYQMSRPTLVLRDPELIKRIFIKDFDHFTDHQTFSARNQEPFWNLNLFMLPGDEWHQMRTILSPAFTGSKLRLMFELINECAEDFVHFYRNEALGQQLDVEFKDSFSRFSNDVIATCAFGVKVDSLREPNNEFYLKGRKIMQNKLLLFFIMPSLARFLGHTVLPKELSEYFSNLILTTMKAREENNIVRPDLLNLLIEARKRHPVLTDAHAIAQGLVFFFGGFETSTVLMCFTAYELALNADIQHKLYQEISQCNGKITYQKLMNFKYLQMVITETLRKWPPVIATDRICVKPYTITGKGDGESDLTLEVGDQIWLPILGLHRDPKYFEDPDKFDPERFREGSEQSYVPFGVGPRNCVASRFAYLESKVILCHLLLSFELTVIDKTKIPVEISKDRFNMNTTCGHWLGLKPRK